MVFLIIIASVSQAQTVDNARRTKDDADLRYWIENMIWYHRFSESEISEATGLRSEEIRSAVERFRISDSTRPLRQPNAGLLVFPYPGGRHPRIGFLEGAVRPQRETKISIFTPWEAKSYVVADVPEAIWSNLGLTYLAHTHVPTVWTKQNVTLPPLEWQQNSDGSFELERKLPNGIRFGTKVRSTKESVLMEEWLFNGTDQTLTDLRVQNCVMLKAAEGFNQQKNDNKIFKNPYVVCRSADGKRWIITAWEPCHRPWANPPVPCLHSDPKFPDCPPGETRRLRGWLSFYEGTDIDAELKRIDALGWRDP